jgi:hypothetical protein
MTSGADGPQERRWKLITVGQSTPGADRTLLALHFGLSSMIGTRLRMQSASLVVLEEERRPVGTCDRGPRGIIGISGRLARYPPLPGLMVITAARRSNG